MEERELRVGVAGAGFVGAVHARPARLAGATLAGVAEGKTRPVGIEDAAMMQFETEGGAMGTTVISQISAGRKNRLRTARITEAVLESAAQDHWVDVLAREPMEVAP